MAKHIYTEDATNYKTLLRRCQRGAKLLREKLGPKWYESIDKDNLRMHTGVSCVLGQLFQGYFKGVEALRPGGSYHSVAADNWSTMHGFLAISARAGQTPWNAYGTLGDIWKDIFKREERRVKRAEAKAKQLELMNTFIEKVFLTPEPEPIKSKKLKDQPDGLYRWAFCDQPNDENFLVVKVGENYAMLRNVDGVLRTLLVWAPAGCMFADYEPV